MLNKLINLIKGKTNKCNQEYSEVKKVSKYENLNGYRIYVRCEKCGHIKNSYFRYE